MTLDRIILQDVFAFRSVDLDLASIGPGVIAVVGANGQGKTGLLEVVPAVNWQKLPARENDHPKLYATSRNARLEYWWTSDEGRYRALLSIDAASDGVDGLVERILDDGTQVPLNDGKISTLKKVISDLFPSYDLFINSCFAAQGRGDEFARTPPTKRKELFAEFLGLSALLAKAKTASEAAALCAATRERLMVLRNELALQTADVVAQALDLRERQCHEQTAQAAAARTHLESRIASLETQLATLQEAVASHAAATQRVATLTDEIATTRQGLAANARLRAEADTRLAEALRDAEDRYQRHVRELRDREERASADLVAECARITAARDERIADCQRKIDGNQRIRAMRDEILAAAGEVTRCTGALAQVRAQLAARRRAQAEDQAALRNAERQLAALAPIEQQRHRAIKDASILHTVPCGGEGPFGACQFLRDAQQGAAQLEDLVAQLQPKAALAERVGQLSAALEAHAQAIAALEREVQRLEGALRDATKLAGYQAALEASDTRVKDLQALQERARADADEATVAAARWHEQRLAEIAAARTEAERARDVAVEDATRRHLEYTTHLEQQASVLQARLTQSESDLADAQAALATVQADHAQANAAQGELAGVRAELEQVIARHATAEAGLQQVAQERKTLATQRGRLAEVERRLALVDQALIEWRDLAKSLGKGGLTDLEIDAAGPSISATANALLLHCMGGQFSIDLVTQVEKRDGGEMRDLFTVRVVDNHHAPGQWRELRQLSGGQKTIVQEALMCAIAIFVNAHAPRPIHTLWRDETGAALDAQNALQYVEMLRKVRELGALHQVFFVTHNHEAANLADAQIVVADGRAAIVLPPFNKAA